jgi:hypothetical protein
MDSALSSRQAAQMRMHLVGMLAMAAEYSGYAGSFGCCSDPKEFLKIAFSLKLDPRRTPVALETKYQ